MPGRDTQHIKAILQHLDDLGPVTLDELVTAMARQHGKTSDPQKTSSPKKVVHQKRTQEKIVRRQVFANLREDGFLISGGFVQQDNTGRFLLSDKGREHLNGLPVPEPEAGANASGGPEHATAGVQVPESRPASGQAVSFPVGEQDHSYRPKDSDQDQRRRRWITLPFGFLRAFLYRCFRPFLRRRWWVLGGCAVLVFLLGAAVLAELETSWFQSRAFHEAAGRLNWYVEDGPSDQIRFPETGPYNQRLGYSRIGGITDNLVRRGYVVSSQSRFSPALMRHVRRGLYAVYDEKLAAGLTLLADDDSTMFRSLYPQLIYQTFAEIPPLIAKTLMFIEDRSLLSERWPYKNPVLDWSRLVRAAMDLVISKFDPGHDVPGGSTLATQIEKYNFSPEGRTTSVKDKYVQMVSASLKVYRRDRRTLEARQDIVRDYINSVPLGAVPGGGEVRGLGHGLLAWHGAFLTEVNDLLGDTEKAKTPDLRRARARAYKQVLSLFLSQRRPALYLQKDREALLALVQRYLPALEQAGIIDAEFRKDIEAENIDFRGGILTYQPERQAFMERKGTNSVRVHLLELLGLDRMYVLDRMDLLVRSTIDMKTQQAVTDVLKMLKDPAFAEASGLIQGRLLEKGDPADVLYSFTLREHAGGYSMLRVQADNVDGPFNLNEGGKLELGSTAKLRTLATYLHLVEQLWQRYSPRTKAKLAETTATPGDRLTQWALDHLRAHPDSSLLEMLEAAMDRTYSASPNERFASGGGTARFSNFDRDDDHRNVTVWESVRRSINLPFVRIMRDIVQHYVASIRDSQAMLSDPANPRRLNYLEKFAHKEGREFLGRFFVRHRGRPADEVLRELVGRGRLTARRLAAIYMVVADGKGTAQGFADFCTKYATGLAVTDRQRDQVLKEVSIPERKNLQDLAYMAGLHPMELWLAGYMMRGGPQGYSAIVEASTQARIEAYRWLFQSKSRERQDKRIRILLEDEAFQRVHEHWVSLGYPFSSMVPALGSALGSSGDKPAALTEFMGLIASGGVRYRAVRVKALEFGKGTPYETNLDLGPGEGVRVMSAEMAAVLKRAAVEVVESGTAIRLKRAFQTTNGTTLVAGGKTGTGDNRYAVYAPGGRMIESRVKSRTATFAFFIGDRFFGTLTAYVPSDKAQEYRFTSALPVQILKILTPELKPLLSRVSEPEDLQ